MHTDPRFAAAVEAAVDRIEARTSAEVVVVAAPASGAYEDVAVACAGAVGLAVLAFLCWSPWPFDARWFPFDVAMSTLTAWLLARRARARVRLVSAGRRAREVDEAARSAFVEEQVHGTADRTGLLVYVSVAEGRVALLPDQGLLGRVPGHVWNGIDVRAGSVEELVTGLDRIGAVLAEHLPASAHNPNEIPNRPRVRT
jgi:putative membrane protein